MAVWFGVLRGAVEMKQKRILGMILVCILVLVSVFGKLSYGVSAASKIKLKVKNLPKKAKITW